MIDRWQISTFNLIDIGLLPLLIFILYQLYKKWVLKDVVGNKLLTNIFIIAFFLKLTCTIFHSLINEFYYDKIADSIGYYTQILNLKFQFANNPQASLLDFYFNRDKFSLYTGLDFDDFGSNPTANVSLLTLPLGFVFFNSYLCISFFLGFVALIACHKIYLVFSNVFPNCKIEASIATVILPGLCFWSSILLKDTYSLIGLGFGIWYFWKMFILKKINLYNIIGFLFSLALMYYFKPYILVVLFSFVLWFGFSTYKKIKSAGLKILSLMIFFTAFIIGITLTLNKLSDLETGPLAVYKAENFASQMEGFKAAYADDSGETSAFSLGDIDFNNPLSILGAAPRALSAVYFQPFIWEAKKPIMLLSALESCLIFYLFLFALFKTRVIGFFGIIFKDPFLLSFFIFCLFFGTIVAIAAPNFGTLARYKIPVMPFMVFMLLVVRRKIKDKELLIIQKKSLQLQ